MLSRSVVSDSLQPQWTVPARLLCLWGFSRQEYWSGLPCSPSGDLPNTGIEPRPPILQADSLPSEPPTREARLQLRPMQAFGIYFYRCCSVAKSCLTLCDPWTAAHHSSLSFTISWSWLKFMSIESVVLSNQLIHLIVYLYCLLSTSTKICYFPEIQF